MTSDVGLVQRAFDRMRTVNTDLPGFAGGDASECQTEALYEVIEGGGSRGHEADERARRSVSNALDPLGNGWVPRVEPARDCAPGAAARGAFGWGCFEARRVPIVLLASDARGATGRPSTASTRRRCSCSLSTSRTPSTTRPPRGRCSS